MSNVWWTHKCAQTPDHRVQALQTPFCPLCGEKWHEPRTFNEIAKNATEMIGRAINSGGGRSQIETIVRDAMLAIVRLERPAP